MPISGRDDRLVRPSFGSQADARGRGDQQKSCPLVTGVVQCVEATADERVVKRADRQQAKPRRAGRRARVRRARGTGCSRRSPARYAGRRETFPTSGPRRQPPRGRGRPRGRRSKMPRRLTQGPRFVETVTSGEVVTSRSVNSPGSRDRSFRSLPNPSCVDISAPGESSAPPAPSTRVGSCRALVAGRERDLLRGNA